MSIYNWLLLNKKLSSMEPQKTEKMKPENLLSRFRSKEDLYRYMT